MKYYSSKLLNLLGYKVACIGEIHWRDFRASLHYLDFTMKLANVEMRFNLSRKYYSFLSAHKRCGKLPSLQEKSSVYKFTKTKAEREL
jgi:hypothetical protein